MNNLQKKALYDRICIMVSCLDEDSTGEKHDISMGDLHELLAEISNNWDNIVTCDCE